MHAGSKNTAMPNFTNCAKVMANHGQDSTLLMQGSGGSLGITLSLEANPNPKQTAAVSVNNRPRHRS
eukprot:scaffold4599_cov138-Skeletonema_menzelii.AAC.11